MLKYLRKFKPALFRGRLFVGIKQMGYIKTSGVVIKEYNTGDADKVVTVLSRSHGKISVYAKGARRPKSKSIAGTQFLAYSDFVLFKGKDLYNISSCEVVESFYELRNDIIKLTYAAHISDIVNDVIQEEQPSGRVLQLFLNTLHMLSKTDKSPELLVRIFELRFLTILGYGPNVKDCTCCKDKEKDDEQVYFSFKRCGLVCKSCLSGEQDALRICRGTARALSYIISSPVKHIFKFNVSEDVLSQLSKISKRYLRERLEKEYTKLDFLKELGV